MADFSTAPHGHRVRRMAPNGPAGAQSSSGNEHGPPHHAVHVAGRRKKETLVQLQAGLVVGSHSLAALQVVLIYIRCLRSLAGGQYFQ